MEKVVFWAQTYAEFAQCNSKPEKIAWMACHFSPYSTGLSNLPPDLPKGSMLMVNDRIPIGGHDPQLIADQLKKIVSQFACSTVLLDFQRPNNDLTRHVTQCVVETLSCPVGVSHLYAEGLSCPVFLPPPDLDEPLNVHLSPWNGREIWLEMTTDAMLYTITAQGCTCSPCEIPQGDSFTDENLHCHYQIELLPGKANFTLWRDQNLLSSLLANAEKLGVTTAVGLYQQLHMT